MAGQGDKCFFQVFILNPFKARMTTRADLFPVPCSRVQTAVTAPYIYLYQSTLIVEAVD